MTDGVHPAERRQAPRYHCGGVAEIVVPGRGLRYSGRIADLSAGGCFIETGCRLERGTAVEVWINTEGLPLRLAANLAGRRESGVGCRFHSVTPRKLEQIRVVIAELVEEQAGNRSAEPATGMAGERARAVGATAMRRLRRGFLGWLRRLTGMGRLRGW